MDAEDAMKFCISMMAATSILFAACAPTLTPTAPTNTGAADSPAEKRSANQVLRVTQRGLPPTLTLDSSNANQPVYWLMYDNLVAMDSKFGLIPQVAERWEQQPGNIWRLFLRKGMIFSNGDPLTANDVVFTIKYIVDRKTTQQPQISAVVDAKVVDEYTVDVINSRPDASTMAGLAHAWIMPQKYWESVGRDGYNAKPIGSGPYEMAEWRNGDFGRFTKRTTEHPFRKVIATEVEVRSLTEATAVSAGLRAGELDIAIGQFTGDQVDQFNSQGLTIFKKAAQNVNMLFPQYEREMRNSPTNNIKVRQAMNYAIDRETMSKTFFSGEAQPVGQLGIPTSPFWDENIKAYPYDPAKAKQLLAEAGYPNGFQLPNGLEFTPQTGQQDLVVAIQGYLRDVGIVGEVKNLELAVFLDKFYARNGQQRGDLFFIGSPVDSTGFASNVPTGYSCNKAPENIWYCNQAFDTQFALAVLEPDIVKRAEILKKATQVNTADVSSIYLFVLPYYVVTQPKIKGFNWRSHPYYNLDDVYRID